MRPDFLGSGPPMPGPEAGSGPGINPIVQKQMSNPGIHSVDAIEAEQRQTLTPMTHLPATRRHQPLLDRIIQKRAQVLKTIL